MMDVERVRAAFRESAEAKLAVPDDQLTVLLDMAASVVEALGHGRKVILMGNGGSAADAQHIAAELVGRFRKERAALPAIALTVNTSILTAIGNDYGFENVFERQVAGVCKDGDVVVGISTSGNSPNVLRAIEKARVMGCITLGFTGASGGQLRHAVDLAFCAPTDSTPRIQEVHITAGHILCELVEEAMFG